MSEPMPNFKRKTPFDVHLQWFKAGEYDWTMEPGEYAKGFGNVNPYSSQIMNQLIPSLQGIMGGMPSGAPQSGDFMQSFMASVPGLRGITTETTSGLAREQQESLKGMTGQTIGQVGQELSKLGATYSSAFPRLVGEAMAPEISQLQTQLSVYNLQEYFQRKMASQRQFQVLDCKP